MNLNEEQSVDKSAGIANEQNLQSTHGTKSNISIIPDGFSSGEMKLKPQIYLFSKLIENHYGDLLRFNEMTGKPEFWNRRRKTWCEWTDTEESRMKAYFQSEYGLYNTKMLEDAIRLHFDAHKVNPLIDILEGLEWDGKPRIEHFLHDVLKVDDSDYTRECSRLIFAGGVHRAYNPGCKFDDVIVLIGGQSAGKTTIVRWLNIEDQFYQEIKTIAGKEGIEAIRGVWIGELAELMAMTRAKDVESIKAYITSQKDSYRAPYDKNVQSIPRRCIFIGTTNNPQFLTDKTGNRRFYPVKVNSDAYRIFENEKVIREYIRQAWAEAMHLYKKGELQPYAKKDVIDQIRMEQEAAMEDDWRIGAIKQYLEDTKKVPNSTTCVIELWHCALGEADEIHPTRKDSIEISQIISNIPGWQSAGNRQIRTKWGQQRYFVKKNPFFPAWR